jgi:L-alanine-DL-glutamate epimerase-like enolase superfamily enzyme
MPTIVRLDVHAFHAPLATPVRMHSARSPRARWCSRLEASDGAHGWGEVFGELARRRAHRASLAAKEGAVVSRARRRSDALRAMLDRRTQVMAIQCGEPGPFAQVIGAIDQAVWT